MRFVVFSTILVVLTLGLGFYVHRRASAAFGLSPRARRAIAYGFVTGVLAMPLGRLGRGALPDALVRALTMVGWTLMLGLVISAVLLGVMDLVRLVARLVARLLARPDRARRDAPAPAPANPEAPEAAAARAADLPAPAPAAPDRALEPAPALPRRAFVAQGAAGAALLVGGGSAMYGALFGRHDYVIEEVAVPIPGLPRSLDGFTLVQLSDIHLGLFVDEPQMRAAEELVRKARGDMVVLTGDLVDFDPDYADHLGRLARRLGPLAREGVAAIPGNHDHFTGVDKVIAHLEQAGARVLRNDGRVVGDKGGGFALLGVDDVWVRRTVPGGGPDLKRAIAAVPPDLPRVLLCHNPVFFPEAAGEVALQISGHTHGGQVNLLVRPADYVLPFGYVAGLYQRGPSRLYVNRGFGTAGPPARVEAPPEVTRIVLVSA